MQDQIGRDTTGSAHHVSGGTTVVEPYVCMKARQRRRRGTPRPTFLTDVATVKNMYLHAVEHFTFPRSRREHHGSGTFKHSGKSH